MKNLYLLLLLGLCTLASGCASIVSGTNQSISVDTHKKGVPVVAANCKLTNDKGVWYVATPGSVTVHRSYDDIAIRCEKDGHDPGLLTAKSSTKGMAFGNILVGGVVGAGVDMATGAAYDYPVLLSVEMGEIAFIPPRANSAPADGTQTPATPQTAPASMPPPPNQPPPGKGTN
jgi:uncharacterized protein YceK